MHYFSGMRLGPASNLGRHSNRAPPAHQSQSSFKPVDAVERSLRGEAWHGHARTLRTRRILWLRRGRASVNGDARPQSIKQRRQEKLNGQG
ncbi:hypothetical protein [Caballeronia sp. GAFFF1]|uniref:hypothetical protein n=1 Tax=Caballeronia sp. GAFFF1 TaxID=2921779 RepID=UPI00202986CA|nr:hypothetical protein [Caballeronia sp. GAFFF1]